MLMESGTCGVGPQSFSLGWGSLNNDTRMTMGMKMVH